MNKSKHILKDMFFLCILPVMSLFSFFFYVFWTYPIQILSQELQINEYFLFSNPYLQKSFLVCVILLIFLMAIFKFLPKVLPYIVGFILVFLMGTFLYKITSYDFGTFTDNNSLTTSKSILGYSSWYFALDGIIPILSIITIAFALKKNFYKPILLFFLIFYTTENTRTLTQLKRVPMSLTSDIITLSSNQPNLLFFMFDSLSTPLILDIITNKWSDEQKAWTKDFMFYDNVTSLSLGRTDTSLPNMIGGYEFVPQKQLGNIINKKEDLDTPDFKLYPYGDTDKSFQEVSKILKHNVDISVSFVESLTDLSDKFQVKDRAVPRNIPIIGVSLYPYIPYLFKNNLAANRIEIKASFSWRNIFPSLWVFYIPTTFITSQKTEKPVFYYFENQGAHGPHYSPKYPEGGSPKSIEDTKDILFQQITYNMSMLNNLIPILKKQDIYDTTRIIVVADHGITPNSDILEYIRSIATPQQKNFYTKTYFDNFELNTEYLPVMLMEKSFKTTQKTMQMDKRFLSLADLHGSIINTFSTNTKIPDYLVTDPPKRAFNIPYIRPEELDYFSYGRGGVEKKDFIYKILLTNNKLTYVKVKSVTEGDFEMGTYDFDTIENLPPVEYLD